MRKLFVCFFVALFVAFVLSIVIDPRERKRDQTSPLRYFWKVITTESLRDLDAF